MISLICPSALFFLSGYLIICTTTLSPLFAPEKSFFLTNISSFCLLLSGTTKPNFLLFSKVPTTSTVFLLMILVTIPSGESFHRYSGIRSTSTSSPFIAPFIEAADTKISLSISSHFTNPKPLLFFSTIPLYISLFFFLAMGPLSSDKVHLFLFTVFTLFYYCTV